MKCRSAQFTTSQLCVGQQSFMPTCQAQQQFDVELLSPEKPRITAEPPGWERLADIVQIN
jgi:hypothetical protein